MGEVKARREGRVGGEAAFMCGEELAVAEANYREMKQRIESMGPVNMMALEEFNECDQRFTFLTRERDDLLQSIADTQQAIAELDLATKEKFEHAFHAINKSFSEAFHTIFGGGMAEMRLTEPDSSGDAGIDIVASPPGKRLQNVLLLSGGEKAMTALALLIAIFRYQPSPFCILDEVDAPLDEANVGRFTRLIGEMSGQTQFIIVTHNRKTMEMGSVLYGVTMQEPGVSKLVSVRWEESETTAPKQQAAAARLSVFDVILPTPIPDKGRVLTQLSLFWFHLLKDAIPNHVLSATDFPPPFDKFQDELAGRSMVVQKTQPLPIECVVRGYVSGSGWKDYRATGKICGIPLPAGLRESDQLPAPIFTPATKAASGHDENISFDRAASLIGKEIAEEVRAVV